MVIQHFPAVMGPGERDDALGPQPSLLHQFSPESPSWSFSSSHGTGSQTMTSVKRLGEGGQIMLY